MASRLVIPTRGLRHLALNVKDVSTSVAFYSSLFGMEVVWQPDPDNAYLSSGCDNLALHRSHATILQSEQRLDHVGFIVERPEDVDRAAEVLAAQQIPVLKPPRTHRDGSRSLYFADPDGNVIQILYEPTLSAQRFT
jgi:catechol 2,3-dioxygenase-like lactoylglutathione lyase family enzyme